MSHKSDRRNTKELKGQLSDAGLRITHARIALLGYAMELGKPFAMRDVLEWIDMQQTGFHRATAYRDIRLFLRSGLLREIAVEGSRASYYEAKSSGHHHHAICAICGRMEPIRTKGIEQSIRLLEKQILSTGFSDVRHQLEFFGTCGSCKHTAKDAS